MSGCKHCVAVNLSFVLSFPCILPFSLPSFPPQPIKPIMMMVMVMMMIKVQRSGLG
uniref:Uncharacterized protein n=1 Tax=Tetranychus urticae TaxID=32264 RepID=T1KRP4_TETUR